MNKKLFFLGILSFLISTVKAQEEKFDYEFLGVLLISKTQLYSYKLQFNIYKDSIKGYSYTDLTGPHETKSYIFGTYDKKTNDIFFKEQDVLYTKSVVGEDEFCFIQSSGKLKLKSNKNSFDSEFEGVYEDGTSCASGRIKVVGTKFIEKKAKKLYKKVKNKKKIDSVVKEKLRPERILSKFGKTTISQDETISLFVKKNKVQFEIWDYGKEDGDIVDIYINGKKIISNLEVKRKKKNVVFNLQEGKNEIKVTTVSSGTIKTNTAKIKIYDATRFYELTSNVDKGKSAIINVIVK